MKTIEATILAQFQTDRTTAISEMLDNPHEDGRYKTTDCFADLDAALLNALEAYKSAIREQVVIDALPKREVIYDWQIQTAEAYNQAIDDTIERLLTREEVERPYVELLKRVKEYFGESKFAPREIVQQLYTLTDGK